MAASQNELGHLRPLPLQSDMPKFPHQVGLRERQNMTEKNSSRVLAERKGFEPLRRFPAYTLSRRAPSTTRPPLRIALNSGWKTPEGPAGWPTRARRNILINALDASVHVGSMTIVFAIAAPHLVRTAKDVAQKR